MINNEDLEEGIKQKITNWLTEENLFKETLPIQKDLTFGFLFNYPVKSDFIYSIVLPKNFPDSVIISHRVNFSPEHVRIIKSWNPKEQNAFIVEFLMDLTKFDIEFRIGYKEQIPNRFMMAKRLFIESLNKETFWNSIVKLHNASHYAIFKIQKETKTFSSKVPALPKDQPGMYG